MNTVLVLQEDSLSPARADEKRGISKPTFSNNILNANEMIKESKRNFWNLNQIVIFSFKETNCM